ncbi:hypothetical protein, conserved [Eimeria tenella]|uniref:Uncharacterized protein n=1 Tax=Eimeria tenella TaxID=5802 RepID=U6KKP9_EIMTE|nr:hypothetical protein, conserved [Eimeria tenella]CDJ38685.1 hypothetical protein, conserved [Eimeria tenella]|eukprot:XP_013229453.1 hypothetical protein, conserved [Eimeria tenella]
MGFHFQSYIAMAGRAINPAQWRRQWRQLEGKQFSDVAQQMMLWTNKQFAQISRTSEYRRWWWANPLGMGLVFYGTYKVWHMTYMVRKQKKTAQLVAAAYGQGGQWLNPVPK